MSVTLYGHAHLRIHQYGYYFQILCSVLKYKLCKDTTNLISITLTSYVNRRLVVDAVRVANDVL